MRANKLLFFFLFLSSGNILAQEIIKDSIPKLVDLSEVVVTATLTEQKSNTVPVPVTVITSEEIKAGGLVKLTDAIAELNGAAVTNYFGNGLQLRGLDPAYTLILIDNEPVIGRISGTFDLDRIAIDDVERIEILRGPASALYGSEALAGVVNIITKKPAQGFQTETNAGYGSNGTQTISESISNNKGKFSSKLYMNGFHTSGYDLDKATLYNSGSENTNGTVQAKISYLLNHKILLSLNSRYYRELIFNQDRFTTDRGLQDFNLYDNTEEFSVTPVLKLYCKNNASLSFTNHYTLYNYHSQVKYADGGEVYYNDIFRQQLYKPELIFDKKFKKNYQLTSGAGYSGENISTNRYAEDKFQYTIFLFAQAQATFFKKIIIIGGLRMDNSSVYGNHFSPKISAQYSPIEKIRFIASWGTGFKSPDFRQLYLNFNNGVVGYSVFGSEELSTELASLTQAGQIESILVNENELGKLKPETSNTFDFVIEIKPFKNIFLSVNAFRNDISDMIETKAVAQKKNGQYVYSYVNLNRVFTQGFQGDIKYDLNKIFNVSVGYQYLEAKDKQVVEDLNDGKIYAHDSQTLISYKVRPTQYGGLFNRSRHSGNIKFSYDNKRYKWNTSLRYIYRGRYGYTDKNGSGILDAPYEYVNDYGLLNFSITKFFTDNLSVQASINNLLGYTNPEYIPSISGRTFLITIHFNFNKQNKQ